jgi:hypothetical protein
VIERTGKCRVFKYVSFVLGIIAVVMTLAGAAGCGGKSPALGLPQDDQASIYAAVVRQLVTVDDTFGGELKPPKIFIIKNTDDKAGDPTGRDTTSTMITPAAQDKITLALRDISAAVVWIDKFEDAVFEESEVAEPDGLPMRMVKDGGALITLGNIYMQDDGPARVAGSIYVANLAAGGTTYVLEKKDGAWVITGTTGARWIS